MTNAAEKPPRLIFLACYFPPVNAIASVRAWNVAKYLARSGWEVTVVTPCPKLWRRAENQDQVRLAIQQEGIHCVFTGYRMRWSGSGHLRPYGGVAGRLVTALGWRVSRKLGLDEGAGWKREALGACKPIRAEDVDLILATGSPFVAFEIARQLSRRWKRPYVIDYRDSWNHNPHVTGRSRAGAVAAEAAILAGCSAAITVSQGLRETIQNEFKVESKCTVISNGFDPEDLGDVIPFAFSEPALVYAGDLYPPKRDIGPIMAALSKLETMQPVGNLPWKFHYYGHSGDQVEAAAVARGLLSRVTIHGPVPRADALAAVKGAQVAIVITSIEAIGSVADKGIVTGKLFEAIGLGVPTLVVAPNESDVDGIISQTGLARKVAGDDIDGIACFLGECLSGKAPPPKDTGAYGWPRLIRQLDGLLRDCCVG